MVKLNVPRVLSLGIVGLLSCSSAFAAAPKLVWNIGILDGNVAEFEVENQGDDLFFLHAGDYSSVYGWNTNTNNYTLSGGFAMLPEPLIDAVDPTIGFERALVAGLEDTINIYFHLDEAQVPAGAKYRFDAVFSGINGHMVTLGFNGTEFSAPYAVGSGDGYRGYQQVFTAAQVNAMIGGNVLTLRTENTTGGSYTTIDYLRLTLIAPNVIFSFGADDGSQTDFEVEGAANDAQFYVHAGDYTGVIGGTGAGSAVMFPERVQDALAGGTEGLPRALVPSRPKLDLFFQLTPEEAAAEMLRFEADLFSLAGGSTHDLRFSINGVTLGEFFGVTSDRLASFDFLTSLVNPGANVITIERLGGSGPSGEWIQFDYLQLTTIPEPSSAALLALGVCGIGALRRRR